MGRFDRLVPMQSRTPMSPSEFFNGLRRVRRGLSVSSVLFLSGLSAMVTTVLSSSVALTIGVALLVAALCAAAAYRYGARSEAAYRESLGGDPRTSCASSTSTTSCGNESCNGIGGTCLDRFERELSLRIMAREQAQLSAMFAGKVVLQVGVTSIWPVLTLLGMLFGRLSVSGALVTLLLQVCGVLGLLLVRWSVHQLASAPVDGGLWSDLD